MKKRILVGAMVALACAVSLALAACSSGGSSSSKSDEGFQPALDTDAAYTVKVAGSYSNFEALEAAFDHFNEYYPNAELSYTKLDDYNNTIAAALEGADAPDIYTTYSWMASNEKYAPALAHAENLADPKLGIDLSCIRPGILKTSSNGEVAMVPVFSSTYGMLVNEDIFTSEGLEIPTNYAELAEVCAALKEKGYESPIMGFDAKASSCLAHYATYPLFCATIADNPEAVAKLNALDPSAGEYMRPALETAQSIVKDGRVDLEACGAIEDNYEAVIMRFFEGDVPMMVCTGDTVSGTKKRESQSESFSQNPFAYTFVPVPATEEGGIFLDSPNLEFAVNKDSSNLEMANEFMRFLITSEELNELAEIKRLPSASNDLTFDPVYASFAEVPESRVVLAEALGLEDGPTGQFRNAAYAVTSGTMTIDEAIAAYGTFE